jgi:hypothetical protein
MIRVARGRGNAVAGHAVMTSQVMAALPRGFIMAP